MLTAIQLEQYHRDGYVIVEQLFNEEELHLVLEIALADKALSDQAKKLDELEWDEKMAARVMSQGDGGGRETKFWVDDELGDDMYSAVARCSRIVEPLEQMLDGEVYHWHHKMMLKAARTGGAHLWHQDFGYWHKTGYCLFPLMASCMIAVNRTTKENGCLQVLRGSHHIGLINHIRVDGQATADVDRVTAATARLPLDYLELQSGSAVFFHCNLLHRSDQNNSEHSRWTLICCYNAARNQPYRNSHHAQYQPLEKLDDELVRQIGQRQFEAMSKP